MSLNQGPHVSISYAEQKELFQTRNLPTPTADALWLVHGTRCQSCCWIKKSHKFEMRRFAKDLHFIISVD